MYFKRLLLLLLISNSLFAQRTIPNPIILVHGFTGGKGTWDQFTDYLKLNLKLTHEPNALTYDLNCDGNKFTSKLSNDVCEIETPSIGNYDIYVIDFEINKNSKYQYSNQAAAVKQGYALKFAIARILAATKAEKVTLLGHSMGGLAIREYLQNASNYQTDGKHHVAKMATIGTPHGGSDLGTAYLNIGGIGGKDEFSEAVRDLKTNTLALKQGVYLFGGNETITDLGKGYYNYDVNCNGLLGDNIVGLNEKDFPVDVDVSCIIGGIGTITDSDLIVKTKSQNMNNYKNVGAEIFYFTCPLIGMCHLGQPENAKIEMIQALDEPKNKTITTIPFGADNIGIFAGTQGYDTDEYIINTNEKGRINLAITGRKEADIYVSVYDPYGKILYENWLVNVGGTSLSVGINALNLGKYKVILKGRTSNNLITTYRISYTICPIPDFTIIAQSSTQFCEGQSVDIIASMGGGADSYTWYRGSEKIATNTAKFTATQSGQYSLVVTSCGFTVQSQNVITVVSSKTPPIPTISASSATTFCEGQDVTLSTVSGYDEYRWFKDGVQLPNSNSPQLLYVFKAGLYTVQAIKCGITNISTNSIAVIVKPIPPKPIIIKDDQLDKFLLTSSSTENNQWFLNGKLIPGAINQTFIPQELGNYTITVTKESCGFTSDVSVVKMNKPVLTLTGTNPFCDGDSVKIVATSGFGSYVFSNGTEEMEKNKNELTVKKSGNYTVVTKRGIFKSLTSEPLVISTKPIPVKPTITIENFALKSSSATNNQWSLDETILKDSTGQYLRGISSGLYSVRVIENGCSSEKAVLVITDTEAKKNGFTIKLYPNPNEGTFWVELPESLKTWQIDIFDALGKNIFSKLHKNSTSSKEQIIIKNVIGSYVLRVTTNNKSQSIKFVIE